MRSMQVSAAHIHKPELLSSSSLYLYVYVYTPLAQAQLRLIIARC